MKKYSEHVFDSGDTGKVIFSFDDGVEVMASIFYPEGEHHQKDDCFEDTWNTVEMWWGKYGPPRFNDRFLQDNGGLQVVGMTFGVNTVFIDFLVTE